MARDPTAYSLFRELERVPQTERPPVHLWHPAVETPIDMQIDSRGAWWHEGRRITRPRLVRLFASLLRKEGDAYFLVTPAEKFRIQVQDLPFLVVQMEAEETRAGQVLWFTCSTGDSFPLDAEHPLQVQNAETEPRPCILVRDGIHGLLDRNVWHQLADMALESAGQPGVYSSGRFFALG